MRQSVRVNIHLTVVFDVPGQVKEVDTDMEMSAVGENFRAELLSVRYDEYVHHDGREMFSLEVDYDFFPIW